MPVSEFYSVRMPASFTTFAHLAISDLMCAANCAGVLPTVPSRRRKAGLDLLGMEDSHDLMVELGDNRLRSFRGRQHAVPARDS